MPEFTELYIQRVAFLSAWLLTVLSRGWLTAQAVALAPRAVWGSPFPTCILGMLGAAGQPSLFHRLRLGRAGGSHLIFHSN